MDVVNVPGYLVDICWRATMKKGKSFRAFVR